MDIIINLLKGMVIGISNIIPGVSGGTMAVVMGIYDKLISAINNIFKDFKKNVIFLACIGIGAVAGILLFASILDYLLNNYNEQTNFFFIGLIVGTSPLIFKKATEKKVNKVNYIWFLLALGLLIAMTMIGSLDKGGVVVLSFSIATAIKLFFAGFIAAATMILPGVSGSFVLLLIGLYQPLLSAVKAFDIPLLIPVALGVLVGMLTMTKVIEMLFNKFPQPTYFAILGLVLGSVFVIYPGFTFGLMGLASVVTLALGFGVAYLIGRHEA